MEGQAKNYLPEKPKAYTFPYWLAPIYLHELFIAKQNLSLSFQILRKCIAKTKLN